MVLEVVGEAKVCDDDVAIAVDEEVLELEIAVDDLLGVDVADAGDELGEELAGVLFLEVAVGEDVVEELAARGVVEDDADVLVCFDDVVEADDVRVLEPLCKGGAGGGGGGSALPPREGGRAGGGTDLEDVDLALDLAGADCDLHVLLLYEFYGDLLAPVAVEAELDLSKLALAEGLEEEVGPELGDGASGVGGGVLDSGGVGVDVAVEGLFVGGGCGGDVVGRAFPGGGRVLVGGGGG